MGAHVYPDRETATALGVPADTPVRLPSGEGMRRLVRLESLVGPDPPHEFGLPTTFIRVAFSGRTIGDTNHPKFELLAHDPAEGGAVPVIDPLVAVSFETAVELFDNVNPASAARAHFAPPAVANVYLLKVVIERPGTKLWIRITNTTGVTRDLVWVVASSDSESRQPWLHATPPALAFESDVDELLESEQVSLVNAGTGPTTVAGLSPALGPAYSVSGLPATLAPNARTRVDVGFAESAVPLVIPPSSHRFETKNGADAGPFGAGHNVGLEVRGRVRLPAPVFAAGQQLRPTRARPGAKVTLLGRNFNQPPVSVEFGPLAIVRDVLTNSTSAVVEVPDLPSGSTAPLTIVTAGGRATSGETFTVSVPIIDRVDPRECGPRDIVSIFGRELMIEGHGVTVHIFPRETEPDTPEVGGRMDIVGIPTPTRIDVRAPKERLQAFEVDCAIEVDRGDGAFVTFDDGIFYFDKGL